MRRHRLVVDLAVALMMSLAGCELGGVKISNESGKAIDAELFMNGSEVPTKVSLADRQGLMHPNGIRLDRATFTVDGRTFALGQAAIERATAGLSSQDHTVVVVHETSAELLTVREYNKRNEQTASPVRDGTRHE